MSHGAVKMTAWLIGIQNKRCPPRSETDDRADWAINYEIRFTNAEAAEGLGVDVRTIKRWTRELRQARILIDTGSGCVLGYEPSWQRWFPLPLEGAWALPAHQWRLWAVLASYANREGFAWPRVDTLAKNAGLNERMVHRTLNALDALGAINRSRRRRGSTMTLVRGVTRSADGGDTERRRLLAHRGNRAAGEAGAGSGSVFEAPALVAGLDDLAMMGETVEERRGHLGGAEDGRPLAEGEVCGDDGGGSLVEPAAHEVEQQLPAGLGEGQVAEFVEDDEVASGELLCGAALAPGAELGLEAVDQVDDVVEAAACALS